ncbi:MAG TPA: polysaccharide deacetylase family protein [Nitrospirota bacterium]|nr:polysaccharide deacetylase family protein [Nitrospirota bacterium]
MHRKSNKKIPVLLYHALFDGKSNREKYAMPVSAFERQIAYLAEEGVQSLSFTHLSNERIDDLSSKHAIITFDDGNYSDYEHAYPILKKYDFTATFFVTVNRLGKNNYLDWSHLKEMINGGMSVQSHSLNHIFLSDLGEDVLHRELLESKNLLEKKLSISVDFLSLPGGFYSQRVLCAAKDVGYKGIATSSPGLNITGHNKGELPLFKRFLISRDTPLQDIRNIINTNYRYLVKNQLLYQAKSMVKKVLGSRQYYVLWSKYFKYKCY